MELKPEELTDAAFAPFGEVLRAQTDGFQVVVSRPADRGWQAALNRVVVAATSKVHRHPVTDECFSPITGRPVLLVAPPGSPTAVRAFALSSPVLVAATVWHVLLAPAPALVFICEATGVTGEEHHLPGELVLPRPRKVP
jgi:ureidoglycolate hydrolase